MSVLILRPEEHGATRFVAKQAISFWHGFCGIDGGGLSTMKRFFVTVVLATVVGAFSSSPVFAAGAPMRHGGPHRVIVPTYRFYGPAFGWGYGYDPFWYGSAWPYTVPDGPVTGDLRLEVTPKTAQVFVDGGYAGIVDDFDGHFQHLVLTPGGHRIEISAPGFQPLAFDGYIQPDGSTDYKATMRPAAQ